MTGRITIGDPRPMPAMSEAHSTGVGVEGPGTTSEILRLQLACSVLMEALKKLKHAAVYASASGATKARVVHDQADVLMRDALRQTHEAISQVEAVCVLGGGE